MGSSQPLVVAIAADQAFHFRYPEATELLEAVGLQPVPWSPLADEPLPPGCRAVVLPGGYPELHAAQLAASRRSLTMLAQAAAVGVPIVAECGGLLLLGQWLHDGEDHPFPMAGVLPFRARRGSLSLGYREAEACVDGLLVRRGERLIGHEFHRWQLCVAADAAGSAGLDSTPDSSGRMGVATAARAAGSEARCAGSGAGLDGRQGAAEPAGNFCGDPAVEGLSAALAASMAACGSEPTADPGAEALARGVAVQPGLWQLEGWGWTRRAEGWTNSRLHASWLHLHWAGCPVIPWRLAAAAANAAALPVSGASCRPARRGPPG